MTALSFTQTPDPLNLTLRQSQEWNIGFSYTDQNGAAINLNGYTPALQFRTSALAKTTALSLTVGNGLTFNPSTLPQVQVSADIQVAPGSYQWDLKLTATGQGAIFLGAGTVIVQAEVTR